MTEDDPDAKLQPKAKDVIKKAAESIKGSIRDAFAALIVAAVVGLISYVFWEPVKGWWREWSVPAEKGTHFTILVPRLEGDGEGTQTRHVIHGLQEQFGHGGGSAVHILPYPETLELGQGEISAAVIEAERRGQKWLKSKNADLLLWGSVGAKDRLLRLRFVAREAEGGGSAKPYALSEQILELPADFGADLGAVLAVSAAAAIYPIFEKQGHALAAIIEPAARKLAPLAANPPASFSSETRAQIWHAYAVAEAKLGEERGDNARLETAIAYFRKTLTEWPRERVPLNWAKTQNNLGAALSSLGERESGTARLEEAVAAYREALKERPRERVPLDWAKTQNNLGNALWRLGERESGTARLEEAVAAYREVLKERTRERVPLDWAGTQNNLGNALSSLGERESGTARLEEAAAAYREALKESTRERVPLDWAGTQNNLGAALTSLGERESGTARLEEAATAYREALKEYTRERVPLDWAMTQNNLGAALWRLGERESGTARLEEAAAAYREALKERTRKRVPLDWAGTQNNLGGALLRLGERESGTARLEEAVAAYREALTERTRERVPLDWARTQNNLGTALLRLGERQAQQDRALGCATLKKARAAHDGALEESIRGGASHYEGMARRNLGRLDEATGKLGCTARAAD